MLYEKPSNRQRSRCSPSLSSLQYILQIICGGAQMFHSVMHNVYGYLLADTSTYYTAQLQVTIRFSTAKQYLSLRSVNSKCFQQTGCLISKCLCVLLATFPRTREKERKEERKERKLNNEEEQTRRSQRSCLKELFHIQRRKG